MMKKTWLFLIISLIFIFASCTKGQELVNEEFEELPLLVRSYDNRPINVPCDISRLKGMLERALSVTDDSTLIAIFTDPGRVEYAVITGQKNNIVM